MIVNILCEILVKSDDTQILLRGTAFLKIYIPTCAETIIAQYFIFIIVESNQIYLLK